MTDNREEIALQETASIIGHEIDYLALFPFLFGRGSVWLSPDGSSLTIQLEVDGVSEEYARWVPDAAEWVRPDDSDDFSGECRADFVLEGPLAGWLPNGVAGIGGLGDDDLDSFIAATEDVRFLFGQLVGYGWRLTSTTVITGSGAPHLTVSAVPSSDADREAGENIARVTGVPFGSLDLVWTGPPAADWTESWLLRSIAVDAESVGLDVNPDVVGAIEWAGLCAAPEWTLRSGVDESVRRHSADAAMPESRMQIEWPRDHHADEIADLKRAVDSWADDQGFAAAISPADPATVEVALAQRGEGTAGYYVLGFENSDCYVGQSVAIHKRLVAHRHDRKGIQSIRILVDPAAGAMDKPLGHLLARERMLIHSAQRAKLPTLNKAEMTYRPGTSSVDELLIANGASLANWLADPVGVNAATPTDVVRQLTPGEVASGREALALLLDRAGPDANTILSAQRAYVQRCLPLAAATELTYWVVSSPHVIPTWGTLSNLSIGWTEALRINEDGSGWVMVNGVELLGEGNDDVAVARFMRQHPGAYLDDAPYRDAGAFNLNVRAPSLDVLADLLDDTAVTRAAATAAMHLMRARKVGKNKETHNAILARRIMGVAPEAE